MSQIYAPTKQGKIAMFREARAKALSAGDQGMVRAMNVELATLGVFETTEAVDTLERTVPAKPRRGRKPMPRCEHDMIAARCPDCSGDTI